MNRADCQLHVELMIAHAVCECLGVHDLSLVGSSMLPGGEHRDAVAWRPFSPYLSLYFDPGDDGCINE